MFKNAEEAYNAKQDEQEVIQQATGGMMEVMANDPDPKFQNSQFLQFLKKIKSGEVTIKNNQMYVNPQAQPATMESAFLSADQDMISQSLTTEEQQLHSAWTKSGEEEQKAGTEDKEINALFDNAWKEAEQTLDKEELRKQMDEEYRSILDSIDLKNPDQMEDLLADAWQVSQDLEEEDLYGEVAKEYRFNSSNPYATSQNPLGQASELVSRGNTTEAIMALEAHLQKNSKDAKAWRLLGKLHQENDQDKSALPCFLVNVSLKSSRLANF